MTATAVPLSAAYQALTRALLALETRAVFGVMGEDTAALTSDLIAAGIPYYGARHEAGAVGMADGYAWATGGLGICMVTRGPGVTNAATALRAAVGGHRQVLLITGEPPLDTDIRHDLKVLDQAAVCRAMGVEYFSVGHARELVERLREAVAAARAGRPATLAVPVNVLNGPPAEQEPPESAGELFRPEPASPSASDIDAVVRVLAQHSRPLVLAGRGACGPGVPKQLAALAERTGALLGTTLLAKDLFRGHRLDLGVVGGFASDSAYEQLREIDCVLAFGASLTPFTTGQRTLFAGAPVVQVDADPSKLGASFAVHLGIAADAGRTAQALLEAVGEAPARPLHAPENLARLAGPANAAPDASADGELDPRTVAATLDELLPDARTVILDSGRFMTSPGRFVRVGGPQDFRLTADAGAIGLGLGVALGAAAARAPRTTVLFSGDGGLSMALADLETATRHALPLVVVVMNDRAYGAERVHLEADGLPLDAADLPELDFAAIAAALRIQSASAGTVAELRAQAGALDRAGRGPLLLDCRIRPDITATRLRW
jgi:thiamine pyrophosphate-dependent acetolactate synthase large subunit-like protein